MAFSAGTDRWLIAVAAGDGLMVVSAAALRTAACKAVCRCTNERRILALAATAEMVIRPVYVHVAQRLVDAQPPLVDILAPGRTRGLSGSHGRCVRSWRGGVHAEADKLPGLADDGNRVCDNDLAVPGEVRVVASMRRISSRSWMISSSRGVTWALAQLGGSPDLLPVCQQLLQLGLELGRVMAQDHAR